MNPMKLKRSLRHPKLVIMKSRFRKPAAKSSLSPVTGSGSRSVKDGSKSSSPMQMFQTKMSRDCPGRTRRMKSDLPDIMKDSRSSMSLLPTKESRRKMRSWSEPIPHPPISHHGSRL
jgi:hypothetical protein